MPTNWTKLFHNLKRCVVNLESNKVQCTDFVEPGVCFDYPTFNPLYKAKPYQYFYAISPISIQSRWFDSIIKVDHLSGKVVSRFTQPDIYYTEADFVPKPDANSEDDGYLMSISYNSTSDTSYAIVLEAKTMTLIDTVELPF